MTLLVVGDFNVEEMKKKITQQFSELASMPLRLVKRSKELVQKSPRIKVAEVPFEETLLNLAWKTPSVKHRDIPALDVLSLILGQGDSSRLTQKLRLGQAIVNYVGSSLFSCIDPGFFAISLSTSRENLIQALDGVSEELHRILREPPSGEEVKKAIVNLASEDFYSLETVDGMARKFGSYQHLFGDHRYFNEYIRTIYSLNPEDILRVARKYLRASSLNIAMTTSREVPEAKKALARWIKQFRSPIKIIPQKRQIYKKPPKLAWKVDGQKIGGSKIVPSRREMKGGVVIVRPSHDTPVINLRCAFRGGVRLESPDKIGLTELLSRTWASATTQLSEIDIYHEMESMAASLSSFGGRNTVGLNLTSMSSYWARCLEIFGQVLSEPLFSADIIEREKVVMLEQLKNRNDNPAQVVIQDFMSKMFINHPYGRDPIGDERSIKSFQREDLLAHYQKMVTRANFAAVASGHLDEKELVSKLSIFLENLPVGERQRDTYPFQKLEQTQKSFIQSDKEQTHIVLGYPGLTFTDNRRYTLHLLQSILAGQGGRLFLELRDKASLAYSVAPLRMEGVDAGYFGAYIGCSPEKGKKAVEMMKIEFQRLCDQRVPDSEIIRAKNYLIGRHDIDLQRNSAITAGILFDEVYDVDYTETFRYAERLSSVTSEQVQKLAQSLFVQPAVISAIGRECPW